jgi:hypothetical protein
MSEVQAELEDLKQRMADLEKAEIKLRIQSVGPRGPIGPSGPSGPQGSVGQGERGRDGRDGTNGRNGRDGETPSKDTLESIVVTLLTEYHVLDGDSNPYAGPYAKKS